MSYATHHTSQTMPAAMAGRSGVSRVAVDPAGAELIGTERGAGRISSGATQGLAIAGDRRESTNLDGFWLKNDDFHLMLPGGAPA